CDIGSTKPLRVTSTVPVLVVMSNNWNDWIGEVNRGKNVCSHTCMEFHLGELRICELPWLVENVLGHGKLSHVMKKRCRLDRLDQPFISNPDLLREPSRLCLNPSYMAMRHLVLCVDRHR